MLAPDDVRLSSSKVYFLANGDTVSFQPVNLTDYSYRVVVKGYTPSVWVPKKVKLTKNAIILFYLKAKFGDEIAYEWDDARRLQEVARKKSGRRKTEAQS